MAVNVIATSGITQENSASLFTLRDKEMVGEKTKGVYAIISASVISVSRTVHVIHINCSPPPLLSLLHRYARMSAQAIATWPFQARVIY